MANAPRSSNVDFLLYILLVTAGYSYIIIYHISPVVNASPNISCRKVPDLKMMVETSFFPFLSPFYRHLHMILPTVSVMNIDKPAGFMDIVSSFILHLYGYGSKPNRILLFTSFQMFIPQNPDPNLIENPMKIRWKLSWNSIKISIWWPQTSHEISWNLMKSQFFNIFHGSCRSRDPQRPIFGPFLRDLLRRRAGAGRWAAGAKPAGKHPSEDVEILGKHLEDMEYPLVT